MFVTFIVDLKELTVERVDYVHTFGIQWVQEVCEIVAKTASIKVRVAPEVKAGAEQLFARFGITMTDAINIFLHQSLMVGGLPFDVKQPGYNAETEAAIQEARDISSGKIPAKSFASVRELFEQLDSEC